MFAPPIMKPKQVAPLMRGVLQRKCACGARTPAGGTCASCADKERGLQRKLAIGSSNDPLEHEADRVADQVLANRAPSDFAGTPVKVQRYAPNQAGQAVEAPASVHRTLAMSGRPLDAPIRRDMEARFGHDFSQVRVHDGDEAGRSARDVGASAYTVGRNIVFGPGRYAPESGSGRRLLAHELTHVLQQGGDASGIVQRDTIDDIKKYLSYAIDDWMVTEQEAKLAFKLLKSLPEDQQAAVLMAEGELYLDRLYDNLPSEFLPELAHIAVKVRGLAQAEAQKKSSKKGTEKGAKKSSKAWRQLTSHGGRTLEPEEQELIASITKASPPTSPLAFAEGPRFVLHDTAGDLKDDIGRRTGLARGPLGEEGAAAYVPKEGPAVPSYGLFEPRRVASSQFELGTDSKVRKEREAGYRGIWKEATAAMRSKALVDALAGLKLSDKEAQAERDAAVDELNAEAGDMFTTASWVAAEICKAEPSLKACATMEKLFKARKNRIASTVNVEINMEIGSSEKEAAKGMGERLPPYTENQYTNVRDFYLTTALAAGCYPEITTHWLLDRGMKEGGHFDPRCFNLHHLYELIAAAMGHDPTSEYGIVPVYGVASPANVWWHPDVCGKPPR